MVGRMISAFSDNSPTLRGGMTAALAIAREGYHSQQDVEKAIRDCEQSFRAFSIDGAIQDVRARLAPKPEPPIEDQVQELLDNWRQRGLLVMEVARELAALVERIASRGREGE